MSTNKDTIINLIAKNFKRPVEEITLDKHLIDDLKSDSLDVVELFIDIEDAFGLDIPIEELQGKVKTVGDVIDAIETLIANK